MTTSTLLMEAQANTLAAVKQQVIDWNNVLHSNYVTAFDNWAQSVIAGRSDNFNPPQPPKGYVVGYFNDPTTGPGSMGPYGDEVITWPYPMIGNDPVTPMPAIPAITGSPKPTAAAGPTSYDVGQAVNAQPPAQDGIPIGFEIPHVDGSLWVKQVRNLPFGTVYLWVREK